MPASIRCKDYVRTTSGEMSPGAIEFARSIHAFIDLSSKIVPAEV